MDSNNDARQKTGSTYSMNDLQECECGRTVNVHVNARCPSCGEQLEVRL